MKLLVKLAFHQKDGTTLDGASDYKVHWLGWEAQDFELVLDLDAITQHQSIQISTLYDLKI